MSKVIAKKAKALRTLPQQIVKAGVKAAQPTILQSYRRDSGGDLRLSGVRGDWKFTVPTSVRGTGAKGAVRGRVRVRPAGPASWLNSGTRYARPKRTFDQAVPASLEAARREVKRVFHEVMG